MNKMEIYTKYFICFTFLFHENFAALKPAVKCLDETGTKFLGSAQACENIRDDAECAGIFREAIVESPAQVDTNCPVAFMEPVAIQCAKRCGLCCEQSEFTCGDDETSPIDCVQNRQKCKDPEWTYVMEYFCPGTCGACLSGSFCRDLNPGCLSLRQLCNDMNFMSFMTARCARTCQRCNTTLSTSVANTTTSSCACTDTATNCAANVAFCNHSEYFNLMSQKCPATCGRCSNTISVSSTCTDRSSNCAAWVSNGFCSNTFYSMAQKRQFCGRSCNLC